MNTMPKDFYIDILHQLQADISALEARNIYVSPENAVAQFRRRVAAARKEVYAARRRKVLGWTRVALGTGALLLLLGAVGGLSQGNQGWGAFFLELGVATAAGAFAWRWRGWPQ
jgi:hypothetical protein